MHRHQLIQKPLLALFRKHNLSDLSWPGRWSQQMRQRRFSATTHKGRSVWRPYLRFTHINCPELLAVLLVLMHFLPFMSGHNVLIRSDKYNCAGIHQLSGWTSVPVVVHTILWSSVHLLSLALFR